MNVTHTNFFFFNDPAPTDIYTLSLHDALPIWRAAPRPGRPAPPAAPARPARPTPPRASARRFEARSEEHTSELQSQFHLVCRLLLEKKKKICCVMLNRLVYTDTKRHTSVHPNQ